MNNRLANELRMRPWWMQLIWLFCLYMTFIYLPYDLVWKPIAQDEEVWLGFVFTGMTAKLTAPLHWLIYGLGSYGFWRMKRWMWPWAALYVGQIAIGMLIWSVRDPRGDGWTAGLIIAAIFLVPAIALFQARNRFSDSESPISSDAI